MLLARHKAAGEWPEWVKQLEVPLLDGKLDLVSREEFDVQTKVLLRTREKLAALEAKLAQLEQQLGAKGE